MRILVPPFDLLNNSHLLNLYCQRDQTGDLKRFAQYFQDASRRNWNCVLAFCLRVYRVDRTLAQRFLNDVAKAVAELLIQIFVPMYMRIRRAKKNDQ